MNVCFLSGQIEKIELYRLVKSYFLGFKPRRGEEGVHC
jgi:hypothetical protein